MDKISSLESQLLRDEGMRLKPYRDSLGNLTIGVGRNLDDVGISADEARILLANDIANVMNQLAVFVPWIIQLDSARAGVLQNMAFNLGIEGLMKFTKTLALVKAGDYEAASIEVLASDWARQVGPRALRLALQLKTGTWQ